MAENYQLPIDGNWDVADMVAVSELVDAVLQVYEGGCERAQLLEAHRAFTKVMPAKSEQKRFDRDFEEQTGRSIYQTVKMARESDKRVIKGA
ncbi:UPF0223 family protein [Fructobacillus parabroussonetiae]|uniref:Uncharacterized protein n=1 Tax=Fructobacillus parabroussonetiae TaxID=2713174 RepID=A0ABS5QVQ7_9LACO|nr:UPF0223 family protein [Fructobacillus parabroussonetiae]MBS9337196.1 hypothetical protein [Fructobacillus parabroussonetiae]